MLKRWMMLLSVSMMALLVLTACGGDDDDDDDADAPTSAAMTTATMATGGEATMPAGGGAADGPITVTMNDTMKFDPATMTVAAGSEVSIHLVNAGAIEHDFSLDESDVDEALDGGDEDDFTFTAPSEPGTYEYYCSVPGHAQAGMKGELVVQ